MIIKKILFNFLLVAIIVFVMDFAIGRILRILYFKETSGFLFRTTYAMEDTKEDILVFGSSRANHHYVPEILEDSLKMSFYNTGRDGNGIFFQTAVLTSILKRYSPKLIILDFFGDFKKNKTDYDRLSSLLPYYRTHEEIRRFVELKSPFERIKLILEIYPFNSQILAIIIGNLEINKNRYTDDKGYVPLYEEWHGKIDSVATELKYDVDSVKLHAFQEFISMAKKSDAKVVVIYSPIFRKIGVSQEIEICDSICSFELVPFWDFSKDTLFINNNHLFRDVDHLNNKGAKIFSELIVEKIKHSLFAYHINKSSAN
jgi:hypothetical protein